MNVTVGSLADYEIGELIHHSDRTLVYRGLRKKDSQPVVIKLMENDYPSFNELVQFRNQYAIAKNLDSEGIVKPYTLERYKNRYALIMEDFGGISLDEAIGNGQSSSLTISQSLHIAIQLVEIIQHLHQNRVIHKDIKPANILIHPRTQQVKLIDFSISSLLPKETKTIQTPNVLEGTLAYLSPEQTGRMNRGIDYRSDFYSLGVTFYKLLSGKLPFESKDPLELVHCHIAKMAPSLGNGGDIPKGLASIVMKLMAKNAEDRYQSASGLRYDLEKCLKLWQEIGKIEPFELGERDRSDRFLIPEKLYGRETEVQTLLQAFHRVANGTCKLMLVAGFSGIGKTAVINEVHKPIVRQRGYFIKGKFDQFQRNIPFSAFVQAFQDLMGQLLGESDAQLERWKAKILNALGENGQVIIEVIPELERIIGKQPPVPELSGSAAQNRFNLLFQKFIQVFTTVDHPLVAFIDDLQWADSASLKLMQLLMSNDRMGYLLLLGAYRDNEVFPAHPLMLTVDEIAKSGAAIDTITLAPLSQGDLNRLVADTLSCQLELALPLTELIHQKTKGNPFFATQFLKGLHEDGWIAFNWDVGYWQCDLTRVQELALTDDVVEFMAARLYKLPETTQEILKLAACIGNQFDLKTLGMVCEQPLVEVAAALWGALQEGLVLPVSDSYKFFQEINYQEQEELENVWVGYKFLHDRVQQAAYSLIPEAEKSSTHYKLGQLLLQKTTPEQLDDRLFEIVNNLNYGIDSSEDERERVQIATLNLRAARKAKKSIAYAAAADYLNKGIAFLEEDHWNREYRLIFGLYKESAETEYLKGDIETSETLAYHTIKHAKSIIDRVKIYNILAIQYTVTAQYREAIREGKIALKLLGIEWNDDELSSELDSALQSAQKRLEHREISSLIDLPELKIPEKRSAIELLHNLLPAAYSSNQALWSVLVVKMVNLSLQYGHIPECCFGYSFYGVLVGAILGDYKSGYEFGILSLNLSQKFKDLAQQSKACNILAAFLLPWREPIRKCEKINDAGYSAGLESGQLQFIGYIVYNRILSMFHSSKNLNDLNKEFSIYLPVLERIKHYYASDITVGCQLAILNWIDPGATDCSLEIEETEYIETCRKRDSFPAICIYQILNAQFLYILGHYQLALDSLLSAKELIEFIASHFTVAEYVYYHSLTLLMLCKDAAIDEKGKFLEQVNENQERFKEWSDNCPDNFQHKFYLVEAEIARNRQEKSTAIDMYDRAIAIAKENGFIQDEALANELAAIFYLNWSKEKIAATYMQHAYYCYARWGAKAKVEDLEKHYPTLLAPILEQQKISLTPTATLANTTTGTRELLDLATLMKASRTLSEEIELEGAIANLMQVTMESAGAETVALMLFQEQVLMLTAKVTSKETLKIDPIPVEMSNAVPLSIVNKVKRDQQPLLLENTGQEAAYAVDAYIQQYQPQSILCLPLVDRGQLRGILYLENNQVAGAFTSNRLEVLNLLCSQAAIALENARLYQQVQQALTDLQQAQLQLVQNEKMATLGNLVAGVAHEINNPVGFIGGNITAAQEYLHELLKTLSIYQKYADLPESIASELADSDLDFITEDFPRLITSMRSGVERIRQISISLRSFSRTDMERKTEFNLHEGIDSTILILKYRLKANQQRPAIEIVKEYGDLPEIKCYPGQLNQVFMNLFGNAIDALDESNAGLSYQEIERNSNQIHLKTERKEDRIIVKISDNGKGMTEEVRARIFEQGFTTKPVGKGTGLGMAIARQIIEEKHGGAIACISELGRGTEFIISLPFARNIF